MLRHTASHHTSSSRTVTLLALAFTAFAALAGCSGTNSATEQVDDQHLELIRASKVYLERPGRDVTDKHVGFIEEKVKVVNGQDSPDRIFMAWDSYYRKQVGYYLKNGATFKFNARGEAESLGSYDIQRTLSELYGQSGTYRLAPLQR